MTRIFGAEGSPHPLLGKLGQRMTLPVARALGEARGLAAPDGAHARTRSEAAAINPLAEIVAASSRDESVTAAFAPLANRAVMPLLPRAAATAPHPRIAVRLARPAGVLAYDDLAAWLDNLAGALGERLLRLKGLVRVAESPRPVLVQSVGTSFAAPRPFGAPDSETPLFVVVIARDLEDGELEAVQPTDLFAFSSWAEPATAVRAGSLQSAVVEWM